jgi:hypothetical protein
MRIKVKSLTDPKKFTQWAINVAKKDAERVTLRMAEITEELVKYFITETSRMPTGALANEFFKEKLGDYSWGIGNIDNLNQKVPYWNHIDKGSLGIGANWQHFLPKGYWMDGRWIEDPKGYNGIMPNTPIPAHNYIDKTNIALKIAILKVLNERK